MGTTRLVVDISDSHKSLPGVLNDVEGLIELLYNHNEAMKGLERHRSGQADNMDIVVDVPLERAQEVAEILPQETVKHGRKGKKRAISPSTLDRPASKRPRRETSSPPIEDYEITHNLEIHYTKSSPVTSSHMRRLTDALNNISLHSPNLPTAPFYIRSLGTAKADLLAGSFRPSIKGGPQETPLLHMPVVGDIASLKRHEFTSRHHDLIRACLDLCDCGRADIVSKLTVHPSHEAFRHDATFRTVDIDIEGTIFVIAIEIRSTLHLLDQPGNLTAITSEAQRRVLHELFPRFSDKEQHRITVPAFITSLKPAPSLPTPALSQYIQPKGLTCQLLPFQQRSVFWMLNREGFTVSNKGEITPTSSTFVPPYLWEQVSSPSGETLYLNRLEGSLLRAKSLENTESVKGGILAEEVGCGKTVESIALIMLNSPKTRGPWNVNWNDLVQIPLHEVKTTLIVTPQSLQKQWIDELSKHAPTLKVIQFDGWRHIEAMMGAGKESPKKPKKRTKASKKRTSKGWRGDYESDEHEADHSVSDTGNDMSLQEEWANFCQQYDVVITTYHVLTQELNVAKGAVSRPRRDNVEYGERSLPKSPLIMVEFWRVIMDEVQLSGGVNTVEMVSRVPRVNSFAVSGTPARSTVADLLHVLMFLRVPSHVTDRRTWKRLLSPAFNEEFIGLFDTHLAVRTTKAQVKDEFQLPTQTRYIVPIEFGKVERTIYDDVLETALAQLHVDARGVAAFSGWQMDLSALRNWLHKLRQACTHPQVGGAGKIEKIIGQRGIKSMEEVLETMVENTEDQLVIDRRRKIGLLLRRSHLLILGQETNEELDRNVESLQIDALESTQKLISDDKTKIRGHQEAGMRMMEEAIAQKRERAERIAELGASEEQYKSGEKGKRKAQDLDIESDLSSDEYGSGGEEMIGDEVIGSIPSRTKHWKWWIKTDKGRMWKQRNKAFWARRRENLMLLHKVQLSLGDTYFRLKDSENETKFYAEAESTRILLLGVTEKNANQSIQSLAEELEKIASKDIGDSLEPATLESLLIGIPTKPGILTKTIFLEEQDVIEVLNEQTDLLFEWKGHILDLVTQKLIEDGQPDDDKTPYERALEVQQECEAYLSAYQSLLADRREALIAERTVLAAAEDRNVKKRKTAAALRTAPQPQKTENATLSNLDTERRELTAALKGRALKTLHVKLLEVVEGKARPEELAIAKAEATRLKGLISTQIKQMDRLDKQLAPIRKTFNDRIEYFRQLQAINDSVAPIGLEDQTVEEALAQCIEDYSAMENAVNTRQARQRYLNSIFHADEEEEDKSCVLCKCEFEKGVMLGCVHHFCEDCLLMWTAAKGTNKICPICRAPIDKDAIQRIHFGKYATPERDLDKHGLQSRQARGLENYNVLPEETRLKILEIDVISDKHGSKIMFLVKHLLYLAQEDPGSKSVVFSTWKAGLSIISDAFQRNGIKYIRIDTVGKTANPIRDFETDPRMQVLLLHGEKDVSGLNVTCACRCMIVEPTVNHSFEIQAIARIDRMGQTRPTEVFCYSVEGTVERSILDLGARQGLSLYTKDQACVTMDVTRLQREKERVDAPNRSKKTGDFIASGDDMLAIMFPHLYEGIIDDPESMVDGPVQQTTVDSIVQQTWGDAPAAPSGSGV